MVFREVGNEFPKRWKPTEVGESIEGIYKQHKPDVGPKKYSIHTLEVDGELRSIFATKVLDERLLAIKVGDKIRITYEGWNNPATEDWMKWKVELDGPESEEDAEDEAEARLIQGASI